MANAVDPSQIVWDEAPAAEPAQSGPTGAHEPHQPIDHAAIQWDKPSAPNPNQPITIGSKELSASDIHDMPKDERDKLVKSLSANQYRTLPVEHRIALTGFDPHAVMGSSLYHPEDWQVGGPTDWQNHPGAGFAAGLRRAADAIQQKAMHLKADVFKNPMNESDKDYTDALNNFHEMNFNQIQGRSPGEEGVVPSRFAGNMLAASAIPGGPVAKGIGAALLNQPQQTTDTTTPNQFYGQEATNAGMGGAMAKGGEEAGKVVAPYIGKAAGWVAGKMGVPSEVQMSLLNKAASMDFEGEDDLRKLAAGGGPRQKAAAEAVRQIDALKATYDAKGMPEMGRIAQTSMGVKAILEKAKSDGLFALRDSLAQGTNVDVSRTIKVIDSILADVAEGSPNASKWPEAERQNLIPELQKLRENLVNTSNTPNTFESIGHTRSDIGDRLSQAYKGNNQVIGEKGAANLQRIKDALTEDLSNAAQNSGNKDLAAADTAAKAHYKSMVGTLKDPEIVSALTSNKPDQIIGAFIKANSGGIDKAKLLYNSLDAKGRAAVVASLFDNAMEKMGSATKMGGVDAFVDTMKAQRKILPVFLPKEDEKAVNGIINLMKASQNTGIGTILGGAIGLGAMTHGVAGAGAGLLVGGLEEKFGMAGRPVSILAKSLMTSPAGKAFLTRLSTMDPNASSTAAFLKSMERRLPTVMGNSAYNDFQYASDMAKHQQNPKEYPLPRRGAEGEISSGEKDFNQPPTMF